MGGDARSHGNVEAVVVELLTVGEELTTVCVVPRAAQTAAPAAQDLPTNNIHNTAMLRGTGARAPSLEFQ